MVKYIYIFFSSQIFGNTELQTEAILLIEIHTKLNSLEKQRPGRKSNVHCTEF